MAWSLLIKGGTVVDGSGAPGVAADVAVEGDCIGGIGSKPPATWQNFGEYLDHLRGLRTSVNVVQFVGHGALRYASVGGENRPATADEQKAMERHLAEALDAGAWGYSTGLVYAPSVYGSTEELRSEEHTSEL